MPVGTAGYYTPARGNPMAVPLRHAALRDQLRAMRMRLEHMTEDIVALHSRIKGLDQAIRAREKAVTELEKRRRK